MAKRKRIFYCNIHGGPIYGRGWGGHKSHGTCPNGKRLTEKEYLASGGSPTMTKIVPPRKGAWGGVAAPEMTFESAGTGGLLKGAASLRDKVNAEIIHLESRLDHLRDMRNAIDKILKIRI